jgi:hypothetical protein
VAALDRDRGLRRRGEGEGREAHNMVVWYTPQPCFGVGQHDGLPDALKNIPPWFAVAAGHEVCKGLAA